MGYIMQDQTHEIYTQYKLQKILLKSAKRCEI